MPVDIVAWRAKIGQNFIIYKGKNRVFKPVNAFLTFYKPTHDIPNTKPSNAFKSMLKPNSKAYIPANQSFPSSKEHCPPSPFIQRLLLSFCLFFLLKKHGVKSPFLRFQISIIMLVAHLFCHRFLLYLAGDIHPNPGPLHGKLKFGHWNLNSILTRNKSKISLIEALQATESFDIFAVSESFLNINTVKDDLEMHGFAKDPIRADCPAANNHPQGGVCLYYRENLPLLHRKDLQLLDETIVCEIKLDRTKKLFFILSYRSPSQDATQTRNYFKNLEKIIAKTKLENPAIIVLTGDLNARSPLLWSGEQDENQAGKQLAELITLENMDQIIDEPTHMPSERTSTCIDVIITSNPSAIIDHGVLPSLDSRCKHQIIFSQINFHVPPPPKYKRTIWDYKACNLNALKSGLLTVDWPLAFANLDVDQMVENLTSTLLDLAKTHIPFKIATISDKDAPWFNNRLRYAIKKISV